MPVKFNGSTSGYTTLQAAAVAGSNTLALPTSGTTLLSDSTFPTTTPTNGQIPIGNGTTYVPATITSGTGITITNGAGTISIAASPSVSSVNGFTGTIQSVLTAYGVQSLTSGTSVPFINIPSWVKRITVSISNLTSTTGQTSINIFQLGTGGGPTYTNSGYSSVGSVVSSAAASTAQTTGFGISSLNASNYVKSGQGVFTLVDPSTNTWAYSGLFTVSTGATGMFLSAGTVSLASALTAIQLTTVNGTDTFATGKINLFYE